VRRLAHEAADSGLLSPELAAGISRVKGVKQFGFRAGNWLSAVPIRTFSTPTPIFNSYAAAQYPRSPVLPAAILT
jgi:hypothetical protein